MVSLNDAMNLNVLHFESFGWYRVTAGYFENISEAYKIAKTVKEIDGFNDAWVLENF
jgi:hypothetical protein